MGIVSLSQRYHIIKLYKSLALPVDLVVIQRVDIVLTRQLSTAMHYCSFNFFISGRTVFLPKMTFLAFFLSQGLRWLRQLCQPRQLRLKLCRLLKTAPNTPNADVSADSAECLFDFVEKYNSNDILRQQRHYKNKSYLLQPRCVRTLLV